MIIDLFYAWCFICVFIIIPLLMIVDERNRAKRFGHFRFKWTKRLDDWLYNKGWFRKAK